MLKKLNISKHIHRSIQIGRQLEGEEKKTQEEKAPGNEDRRKEDRK